MQCIISINYLWFYNTICNPSYWTLLLLWNSVILIDGPFHQYLYKKLGSSYLQYIIPPTLKSKVVHEKHETVLLGTETKQPSYCWLNVTDDVYFHIRKCNEGKEWPLTMITVSDIVRRDTPPKNEAAPMSASAPGSIHIQKRSVGIPPCRSTSSRPTMRP